MEFSNNAVMLPGYFFPELQTQSRELLDVAPPCLTRVAL